jgi:dihydropteroate synthase
MITTKIELVGILNVTPDSFSDGNLYLDPEKAGQRADELFDEGADIVDIGAEATNPSAEPITVDEEWRRLQPVVERLLPERPDLSFSIDTHHPEIVHRVAAVAMGKRFYVNDVTTFRNPDMILAALEYKLPAIVSHLPALAEGDVAYAHEWLQMTSMDQLKDELTEQIEAMVAFGFSQDDIIVDPGIGFGKSMALNWRLLEFGAKYGTQQLMIGYSRKRFLATDKVFGTPLPDVDRYDPQVNAAAGERAINASVGKRLLLRVHDVATHRALANRLRPDLAPASMIR